MNIHITEKVQHLFGGADECDWQKVAATMHDTVLLDYSSMNGHPAEALTPAQITGMWAAFLPGFDKTRHQLSELSVDEQGNTAAVHFNGVASHWIGSRCWIVEGSYDVTLGQFDNDWQVTAMTFNFERQSGDTGLPVLALERLKTASGK